MPPAEPLPAPHPCSNCRATLTKRRRNPSLQPLPELQLGPTQKRHCPLRDQHVKQIKPLNFSSARLRGEAQPADAPRFSFATSQRKSQRAKHFPAAKGPTFRPSGGKSPFDVKPSLSDLAQQQQEQQQQQLKTREKCQSPEQGDPTEQHQTQQQEKDQAPDPLLPPSTASPASLGSIPSPQQQLQPNIPSPTIQPGLGNPGGPALLQQPLLPLQPIVGSSMTLSISSSKSAFPACTSSALQLHMMQEQEQRQEQEAQVLRLIQQHSHLQQQLEQQEAMLKPLHVQPTPQTMQHPVQTQQPMVPQQQQQEQQQQQPVPQQPQLHPTNPRNDATVAGLIAAAGVSGAASAGPCAQPNGPEQYSGMMHSVVGGLDGSDWPSELELQALEQQADVWMEELLAAEAVPLMDSILKFVEADQPPSATAAAGATVGGWAPPYHLRFTAAGAGATGTLVPVGQFSQLASKAPAAGAGASISAPLGPFGAPATLALPPAQPAAGGKGSLQLYPMAAPKPRAAAGQWTPGGAGLVGPGMSALMSAIEDGLQSLTVEPDGDSAAVLAKTDQLQQQVLVMQQQLNDIRRQLLTLGCSSSGRV